MAQHQRLFNDGVHKEDYISHKSWYQVCGACRQIPALLQCGHVCCQGCSALTYPCPCCEVPKVIKQQNYKKLLMDETDDFSFKLFEQDLYDFNLSISSGGKTLCVRNQKKYTTIGQIMTQFDDFVQYEKVVKSGLAILVRSKPYLYHQIKDKPISQLPPRLLVNNKKKQSNPIIVSNRNLGGN